MTALFDCDEAYCGYCYCLGRGQLGGALGCVRFGAVLMRDHPRLFDGLSEVPWNALDGFVAAAFRTVGRDYYHVHHPAVGHAASYVGD